MATLRDIAHATGVSVSTVSLVLNGKSDGRVKPETVSLVKRKAEEFSYRPNMLARGLRGRRSHTLALLADEGAVASPFMSELIRGAQDAAWAEGYVLMSVLVEEGEESEVEAVRNLLQHEVDAMIVATEYHRYRTVPTVPSDLPLVLVNCLSADESQRLHTVLLDEVTAARVATEHLIAAGHQRIAYVGTTDERYRARFLREQGFREAMAAAGLAVDERLVLNTTDPCAADSRRVAVDCFSLDPRPTAVFCFADQTAMGIMQVAAAQGIRIPEDLSIVGFDDMPYVAAAQWPPLTTIRLDLAQIGEQAVKAAVRTLADRQFQTATELVACPLVIRETVASLTR